MLKWKRDHTSHCGRFSCSPIYRGCTTVQGWKLYDTERARPESFDKLRDAKDAAWGRVVHENKNPE